MTLFVSQSVKDLRGKVLLEAKKDVMDWAKVTVPGQDYLKKKTKFKDVPALLDDLNAVFQMQPYSTVLEGWVTDFRDWIGELWAPSIIFDELRWQKTQDPYSYRHTLVIAVVGSRLLELWVKTAPTVRKAFLAFLCHDLGKMRVAPTILQKKESLEEAERRAIFEHPIASYVMNACYWGDTNHLCAEVAFHHHEDRAGKGYPQGIKTNSLILDILSVLDRFDALTSERPFRFQSLSHREAFDFIKKDCEDGKIEADVLRALVALVRKEKVKDLKKIKLGTIGRSS